MGGGGGAGVDAALVKSVMLVESNFNPRAMSRKGARGLMQLMPGTALRFGVSDRYDAGQSIRAGVKYLATLLEQFKGDVALALAGYNAGENAVTHHSGVPPYRETREYIRRVLVARHGEGGIGPVIGGGVRGTPPGAAAPAAAHRVSRPDGHDTGLEPERDGGPLEHGGRHHGTPGSCAGADALRRTGTEWRPRGDPRRRGPSDPRHSSTTGSFSFT